MSPYNRNCPLIKRCFPLPGLKIILNNNLTVYPQALPSYTGIMISIKTGMQNTRKKTSAWL